MKQFIGAWALTLMVLASSYLVLQTTGDTAGSNLVFEGNTSFSSSPYVTSGTGTPGNPYLISDLIMGAYNVQIKNTTSHVLVRNLTFSASGRYALYLYNSDNIVISSTRADGRPFFLYAYSGNGILLEDSTIANISGSGRNVNVQTTSGLTIDNCTFSMVSGSSGATVYFNNQGSDHEVRDSRFEGVGLTDDKFDDDIFDHCSFNGSGISIDGNSYNSYITNCTINYPSGNGIKVTNANRVNMIGNTIHANAGIHFASGNYITDTTVWGQIRENVFEGCTRGIEVFSNPTTGRVSRYEITENYFGNCTGMAISAAYSMQNRVWRNIFYHNAGTGDSGSGPQMDESQYWPAYENILTYNGEGNFWQNHRAPDSDNNGIVDVNYTLPGGMLDSAPYTNRYFDTTPPTLTVTFPPGEYAYNTYTVLRYSASDIGSGVGSVQLSLDGARWKDIDDGSTSLYLDKGDNLVHMRCFDRGGLYHRISKSMYLNTSTDPVQLTQPTEDSYFKGAVLEVRWTVHPQLSPVNQTLEYDGEVHYITPSHRTFTIPMTAGPHVLKLRITDPYDMVITRTSNFTVDVVSPTLRLLSPQEGSVLSNPIVGFRIEATDDQGIGQVKVMIDGKSWDSYNPDLTNNRALQDGMHVFNVTVSDLAGWTVHDEILFGVFTKGNESGLFFVSPEGGIDYTSGSVYTVIWDYTGSLNWSRSLLQVGSTGSMVDIGGSRAFDVTLVEEGPVDVVIRLEDDYGNYVQTSGAIVRDTRSPRVIFEGFDEGQVMDHGKLNLSWTVTDMTPIVRVEYILDGSEPVTTDLEWLEVDLGEGTHSFTVRAWDSAGNMGESSRGFRIDTTPSLVTITRPKEGSFSDGLNVRIEWSVTDPADMENLTLYIDGDPVDVTGLGEFLINHIREEGPHNITLISVDRAGNSDSATVGIMVDRSPPSIEWTIPPPIYTTTRSINVSWARPVDTVGVKGVQIVVDGNATDVGVDRGYRILTMTEGSHNITLRVTDLSGKIFQTDPLNVVVDTIDPVVRIDMEKSVLQSTGKVVIFWTVEETGSGLSKVEISEDGGPWLEMGTLRIYESNTLAPGFHSIEVRASDNAGNIGNATWGSIVEPGKEGPGATEDGFPIWIIVIVAFVVLAIVIFVLYILLRTPKVERKARTGPRKLTVGLTPAIPTGALSSTTPASPSDAILAGKKVESTDEGAGYIRPKAHGRGKRKDRTSEARHDHDHTEDLTADKGPDPERNVWHEEKQRVIEEEAKGVFVGTQPMFSAPAPAPTPTGGPEGVFDGEPMFTSAPGPSPTGPSSEEDEAVMFDEDIEGTDAEGAEDIEELEGIEEFEEME